MNKTLKTVLSLVLIIVFLGSTTGLILTLTAVDREETVEANLKVTLYPTEEIFTCAYKIYGDDNMGYWAAKTSIKNVGNVAVEDFSIEYTIDGYCDWSSTEVYPIIIPGETVRDYFWPNLDPQKMSEISTKTPAELTMKYDYKGLDKPIEDTEKIFFLGKNDYTWTSLDEEDLITHLDLEDNYPLLAAFVTPNEELVKSTANDIAGGLETVTSDDDAYQALIECFYYLREGGLEYIQEPSTFWTERIGQYIQYPHETLSRNSGTCMDLAICVAALMEAVAIKSYVALLPTHVIPIIELPESGELYAIEATFIDQEYAYSHFPDFLSPDVTADECMYFAQVQLDNSFEEGTLVLVDIEEQWDKGMIPSW